MPCRILRSLYLRANGEIPCDDDFGEQMNLGWVQKNAKFSPSEIFSNEKYQAIEDGICIRGHAMGTQFVITAHLIAQQTL